MPLSLRCATALFGHFGVEWDITQASADERTELARDEPITDQPTAMRVPGLDPQRRYLVTDVTPGPRRSPRSGPAQGSEVPDNDVSGAALGEIGLVIPAQLTLTALVMLIEAC
jgi:hypothetical protein